MPPPIANFYPCALAVDLRFLCAPTAMASNKHIQSAYALARDTFAQSGVDADRALQRLAKIPISLHCWQGDDVGGFENSGSELGGGLAVTGNYPGKARTAEELRSRGIVARGDSRSVTVADPDGTILELIEPGAS